MARLGKKKKKNERSFFTMAAAYLPSILVPLVGLVFPAIAMASLFLYIEKEEIV
jgi:photosystem I subunit 8